MAFNDKAWHVGFKWTIGDPDNNTGAIALDEGSDALHICDINDVTTNWNVSTKSHPTLYLHSASDPATDYISMYHDGTSGIITLDGTTLFTLTATTVDIAVATTIAGDLDITTDDIAVSQGYYMYFDGLGNNTEYIRSDAADYMTMAATTGIDLVIGTTDEVAITATAVTLATNNLSLAVGSYIYLDGDTGNYLRTSTDDNVILNGGTTVKLGIAGTAEVSVTGSALYPETDDGQTLGIQSTNEWSDLYLADGGVIAWNNRDVRLQHTSANVLEFLGGNFRFNGNFRLEFRGTGNYIYSPATDKLQIVAASTAGDAITLTTGSNGGVVINSGKVTLEGYLRLKKTTTDGTVEGMIWYDTIRETVYFRANGETRRLVMTVGDNQDIHLGGNYKLYMRSTGNYIYSPAADHVAIVAASTTGDAILLSPGSGGGVTINGTVLLEGYLRLRKTTTDSTTEGDIWYDTTRETMYFRSSSATRRVVMTGGENKANIIMNGNFNLAFRSASNYIYSPSTDHVAIVAASTEGNALFLSVGAGSGGVLIDGKLQLESFLRLGRTASVGSVEGQIWYDNDSNKIHFWDGSAEQEVQSAGA